MVNYLPNTFGRALIEHKNDYVFNVEEVLSREIQQLPRLSIGIPFFEKEDTFPYVIKSLIDALEQLKYEYIGFEYEILVVNDGDNGFTLPEDIDNPNIRVIEHQSNQGTWAARNTIINSALGELLLFIDADVIVSGEIILNHIKLAAQAKNILAVSFFNTIHLQDFSTRKLHELTSTQNDFRVSCTYLDYWIGCEEDKELALD